MSSKKSPQGKRPLCKYGTECYRKNAAHFEEFRHPEKGMEIILKFLRIKSYGN